MSENDRSQGKRTSALTWYSVYQSQVVGQPNALWAPEEPGNMLNGYDEDDSIVRSSEEQLTLDWNHSKDSDDWNHLKDADNIKDGDQPESSSDNDQQHPGHASTLENKTISSSSTSSLALLRPLSMDDRRMKEDFVDEVERRSRLVRSRSTIPKNWDEYEEVKMPRRYQKPTNTKINTRLSRTFITGAGSDTCKRCGQRLYAMEKINANHSSYHRTCFQCSRCQRLLSLSNFISIDGLLYCNSHFLDVVCNKSNVSETQTPNALEQKERPLLSDVADEINKEVTLTSIANIKSRFEIPSNNQIGLEKKSEKQEQQKIPTSLEVVSNKAIMNSRTQDVESQHPKITIKDSASSHEKPIQKLFEVKAENTSSRYLREDEETFATPPHPSNAAPPFIKNDESDSVADAFAKFKSMEHMHMERIPNSEVKQPVRKTPPPPTWELLRSSANYGLRENKETRNHISSYSDVQNVKTEERLPTAHIHEPVMNQSKMSPSSKDSIKSEERRRAEVNAEVHEDDAPPVGITRQLVAQWKLMDTLDGTIPLHRSIAPVPHAPSSSSSSPLGRSATELALAKSNTSVAHSLQFGNGYLANGAGSSSSYDNNNTLELVRTHKDIVPQDTKRLRKSEDEEMTAVVVVGSLDFTRHQLAKFKELEAIAQQQSANAYPTPRKDFRWDVKEVSPLHRPIIQPNLIPIDVTMDDSPAKQTVIKTPFADQTDAWNGRNAEDHPIERPIERPVATHAPLAEQRDVATEMQQQSILACMKEALAQFKSMEDLSRPAPNPVLALSKQKAAIASTHTKQYHDIIHHPYAMQTVKD